MEKQVKKMMIMKIKSLILFLSHCDPMGITKKDINSPLLSYLLAKVQRLEAKNMVRPNIRNTRATTKQPVVADKQCKCPLSD